MQNTDRQQRVSSDDAGWEIPQQGQGAEPPWMGHKGKLPHTPGADCREQLPQQLPPCAVSDAA